MAPVFEAEGLGTHRLNPLSCLNKAGLDPARPLQLASAARAPVSRRPHYWASGGSGGSGGSGTSGSSDGSTTGARGGGGADASGGLAPGMCSCMGPGPAGGAGLASSSGFTLLMCKVLVIFGLVDCACWGGNPPHQEQSRMRRHFRFMGFNQRLNFSPVVAMEGRGRSNLAD
jgi:hypothetical protein